MATFRSSWPALVVVVACHHAKPPEVAPLPRAAYAHYLAGKLALYREDFADAASELGAAAKAAPDQPTIAVEQARALAKAKRADDARAVLQVARTRWPKQAQVWLASGELLEKVDPIEAHRAYRRAIELEPDGERAYLGLARMQASTDAEATLRALVAHVPGSVDGHYRLAQRLAARSDLGGAQAEWRIVLERDPDHIDARIDLARALRRAGKLSEAIAETRSAFDRASQPMDIAEELFWLLCEADDVQGAIDLLTLLDDDRSDAEALATVARLEIQLGRIDQAAALGKKLAAMDGGTDAADVVGIEIDLARHDYRTAAERARTAKAKTAPLFEVEAALGAGEAAQARAQLEAVPAAERPVLTARVLELEGNIPGAIAALEEVIRKQPDNAGALNVAGYLLADGKTRLDDAERYIHHARELAPGDPSVLDSWGWLQLARGRAREAVATLERASRLAPLEAEILLHLASAYTADAQRPKATAALAKADTLHPSVAVKRKIDALRVKLRP